MEHGLTPAIGGEKSLDFKKVCIATLSEDMLPMNEGAINSHLYGIATVCSFRSAHNFEHNDVVAYAGVLGIEEYDDIPLAKIGGVITLPGHRHAGHGTATVGELLAAASTDDALAKHGHTGFIAKCSANNVGLFVAKFGFEIAGQEADTHIAIKHFTPKS